MSILNLRRNPTQRNGTQPNASIRYVSMRVWLTLIPAIRGREELYNDKRSSTRPLGIHSNERDQQVGTEETVQCPKYGFKVWVVNMPHWPSQTFFFLPSIAHPMNPKSNTGQNPTPQAPRADPVPWVLPLHHPLAPPTAPSVHTCVSPVAHYL